jgi:hypothetical protein
VPLLLVPTSIMWPGVVDTPLYVYMRCHATWWPSYLYAFPAWQRGLHLGAAWS